MTKPSYEELRITKHSASPQPADSACGGKSSSTAKENREAIEKLMRIHYQHFMSRKSFWYDKELIAADMLICVAASNLRMEIRNG